MSSCFKKKFSLLLVKYYRFPINFRMVGELTQYEIEKLINLPFPGSVVYFNIVEMLVK